MIRNAIIFVATNCHFKQNYILLENKIVLITFFSIKVIMEGALDRLIVSIRNADGK